MNNIKIKKAVLDNFDNVLGYVSVPKNVKVLSVAWELEFTTEIIESTERFEAENPGLIPNHTNIEYIHRETNVVAQEFNTHNYRLSYNSKYCRNDIIDRISIFKNEEGESVYYLNDIY